MNGSTSRASTAATERASLRRSGPIMTKWKFLAMLESVREKDLAPAQWAKLGEDLMAELTNSAGRVDALHRGHVDSREREENELALAGTARSHELSRRAREP
jgi:hypothetical protein